MEIKKNDKFIITIEDMSEDGAGIGKLDGYIWFVKDALIGDVIEASAMKMKKNYGFAPILLLDDVFDKLDMGRISNLLQMVASNDFGQIFITDSNKVRMSGIVDRLTQDRAYYDTVSGSFTRL